MKKNKFILVFLLIFQTTLSAVEVQIPIESFFSNPVIDGIRISPDGKYYAARLTINGSKNLAIMDLATNKHIYTFNFGDDEKEVGSFGWLNNERIYASMNKKVGPLEITSQTGYLFAGNIDGSKKRQLLPKIKGASRTSDYPRPFEIMDKLEDDPENIMIRIDEAKSNREEVVKLNVYTGRQFSVADSLYYRNRFEIDHNAKVRIVTTYDETYEIKTVYYRDSEESDWIELSKNNVKENSFGFITFTPDNNQFYYFTNNAKDGTGVFLFDPKTKTATLVHQMVGDQNVKNFLHDENTNQLFGIVREKGVLVNEYFAQFPELAKKHKEIDVAFPDEYVETLNYTKDKNLALLFAHSDKNAGSFYLYNIKSAKISYLMNVRPKLPAAQMAERRPIEIKVRDEMLIRGFITLPKGKDKSLPMVVVVHGGPYGVADEWTFDREAQFFAHNGYAVLQVNYRGSGGRGLNFVYDNYRKMGREMQDDITDATLWAVEQGYANKDKLCIYGASYGGYAAIMGATKEPELYQCAIGYAGVYDIAVQADSSDTRTSDNGRQFLEDAWNAYDDDFIKARSPVYFVDKIKAAIFLAHGTSDKRTPLKNYEVLTDALDKIKYPYEKLIKEDEGHGFQNEKNKVELYTKMLTFLDKHIGASSN